MMKKPAPEGASGAPPDICIPPEHLGLIARALDVYREVLTKSGIPDARGKLFARTEMALMRRLIAAVPELTEKHWGDD